VTPRVLFVSSVIPWPLDAGNHIRVYHLLRAAAEVAEITLVCFADSVDDERHLDVLRPLVHRTFAVQKDSCGYRRQRRLPRPLQLAQSLAEYCHPTMPTLLRAWESDDAERLMRTLSEESFDVVWGERLGALQCLRHFPRSRRILDLDDVEHRKLLHKVRQSPLSRLTPFEYVEAAKLRRLELGLTRDRGLDLIVCSELDRARLGGGPRVHVVPNGVELPEVVAPVDLAAPPSVVFVGTMSYSPNVDAARFFVETILPLIRAEVPDIVFTIVGKNPAPAVRQLHDGRHVIVAGGVPSVTPYLQQSRLVVTPIRFGGGTRIKILEAMAHRRPVVSTSIGAEGIDADAGRHLLVADDPRGFAAACTRLLQDRRAADDVAAAGFGLVESRYQWQHIERRVADLVRPRSRDGAGVAASVKP
jgi:glycosyltransferase involved in cell wall biosynthesis